jgi:hypothetical protein
MPPETLRKDGCADLIPPSRLAPRPADGRPVLLLLAPTHRGVGPLHARRDALAGLAALEAVADRHGVVLTYAVDHPLAVDEREIAPLVRLAEKGRAELAAHLVPALTPPLDGTPPAPMPGNLPRALEREKLVALLGAIEVAFGIRPTVYVAAGGGVGRSSPALLAEAGITVDASARPGFDLRLEGGPNFADFPPGPFFYPGVSGLLGIPRSGARISPFTGRIDALEGLARLVGLSAPRALDVETASASELARIAGTIESRGAAVTTLVAHVEAFAGPRGAALAERLDAFLGAYLAGGRRRASTHAALRAELVRTVESAGPYAKSRRG